MPWNTAFATGDFIPDTDDHHEWDDAVTERYRVIGDHCPPAVGPTGNERCVQALVEDVAGVVDDSLDYEFVFSAAWFAAAQTFFWDRSNKYAAEFELYPDRLADYDENYGYFADNMFVPPDVDMDGSATLAPCYWAGGQALFTSAGLTSTIGSSTRYGFRRRFEAKIPSLSPTSTPVYYVGDYGREDTEMEVNDGDYARYGSLVYQAHISGGVLSWTIAVNALAQETRVLQSTFLRESYEDEFGSCSYVTDDGAWRVATSGDYWGTHLLNDINSAYNVLTVSGLLGDWSAEGTSWSGGDSTGLDWAGTKAASLANVTSSYPYSGPPFWWTHGSGDVTYGSNISCADNYGQVTQPGYPLCDSRADWFIWTTKNITNGDAVYDGNSQDVIEDLFSLFYSETGDSGVRVTDVIGVGAPAAGSPVWCVQPYSPNYSTYRGIEGDAIKIQVLFDWEVTNGFVYV